MYLARVVYLIGFLLGVETGGLQYVLFKIASEFHLSQMAMGSLVSMQFVAVTIAPLVVGPLSDRVGKKIVIIIFCFLFAVSGFICLEAGSIILLKVGICGIGVSFGALEATITGTLSDAYPQKSGKYITIMQGFLSLGAVLGPIVISLAMNYWKADWRLLFWLCCIFALSAAILSFFGKFQEPEQINEESDQLKIMDKVIFGAVVLIFGYLFVENGVTCFIDSFFSTVVNKPTYSATALSTFWMAMAISRMVMSLFYAQRNKIIPVVCLIAATLLISLRFVGSPMGVLMIFGAVGFCYGPISPFLINMAVEQNPQKSGTVAGFMLAASGLGGAASPVIAGYLSDVFGLQVAYFFIGCMVFVEMAFYIKFTRRKKKY